MKAAWNKKGDPKTAFEYFRASAPYSRTMNFSSSSSDFPLVSGIIFQTKKKNGTIMIEKNIKIGPPPKAANTDGKTKAIMKFMIQ